MPWCRAGFRSCHGTGTRCCRAQCAKRNSTSGSNLRENLYNRVHRECMKQQMPGNAHIRALPTLARVPQRRQSLRCDARAGQAPPPTFHSFPLPRASVCIKTVAAPNDDHASWRSHVWVVGWAGIRRDRAYELRIGCSCDLLQVECHSPILKGDSLAAVPTFHRHRS